MKTLLGIFLLMPLFAFPQFNYKKLTLSAGGGITIPHTDITDFSFEPVVNGAFHYNITPYAAVGLDAEAGKLSGNYHDASTFESNFATFAVDARLQVRQFTGENVSGFAAALSRLYAGAGLGMIHSDATSIPTGSSAGADDPDANSYKGSDIIVPVFAGINIPVMKQLDLEVLSLFVNYRLNISFSDELDAWASPGSTANDHFSTISLGVRFNLGQKGPYFFGVAR